MPEPKPKRLLSVFEIHRDHGATEEAKKALQAALKRTLDARQLARNDASQARAERLLARVLEHYGNPQASRRALERAYEASSSDTRQLAATLLDSSRRALTSGDLAAARDAVQRAVEARLPDDDLVYVALWLQLLEKKLNVASDGTAEEAYAAINDASGWPAKLRAWARGKLSDTDLMRSARSRVERTEATFYTAMASVCSERSRCCSEAERSCVERSDLSWSRSRSRAICWPAESRPRSRRRAAAERGRTLNVFDKIAQKSRRIATRATRSSPFWCSL